MSGTDALFPGAEEHPGISLPSRQTAGKPDHGRLGFVAFFLGMAATVGNISGAATGLATITAVASQLTGSGGGLAHVDWVIPFEIGVLVVGVLFGAAALVLGIRAARGRRSRVLGIIGAVLGGLALGTDLLVAALVTFTAIAPG
jgi:hypothetical protein